MQFVLLMSTASAGREVLLLKRLEQIGSTLDRLDHEIARHQVAAAIGN